MTSKEDPLANVPDHLLERHPTDHRSHGGIDHSAPRPPSAGMAINMDLRDWFAGLAMQGMYAHSTTTTDGDIGGYARAAYAIADAMMEARRSR